MTVLLHQFVFCWFGIVRVAPELFDDRVDGAGPYLVRLKECLIARMM